MRVAFVGAGHMGGPMASHVAGSDHELSVYDPKAERLEPLVSAGARAASSPADAAEGADVVSVVVLDDAQVLEALTGTSGVLESLGAGAVLAIHSTVTRACLRTVEAAAEGVGVRVLDAGISGGVPGARAGTLVVIAGGEQATLDAARPAFAPWSSEIVHVGPVGAGMTAKVARNFIQYACFAAVHEGRTLAQAAGVDLSQFAHIVSSTNALGVSPRMLGRPDATPRAPSELGDAADALVEIVELGLKDLDVAEATARELDVELDSLPGTRANYGPSLGVDLRR
jgi:3-hydroxyisobutyrate dehydrogenase-like beta-hydroxyacid dehydrogenase